MSLAVRAPALAPAALPVQPPTARLPSAPTRALAVVAPASLSLALGMWGIRRQGTMWGDEAVTYRLAQRELHQLWETAQQIDLVHALYYAVMHVVFDVFGAGLLSLRLPSVLAMAAAAGGVGLLGLLLAGPRAGVTAGLVFALLPQVQKYAQEGRSYAMVCALIAWATCALVISMERRGRRRWAVYGFAMLLACLLHEFAVLALAAHGVTLIVSHPSRAVLRAWTVTAAGVVAGLLPLAIVSAGQSEQVSWIGGPVRPYPWLAALMVGLVCTRVPLRSRGTVRLTALAVPLLVLPGALLLTVSLVRPIFVDRYVLFSDIGLALLLGAFLEYVHRLPRYSWTVYVAVPAALIALAPLSSSLRTAQSRSNDATAIGAAVRTEGRPGDGLLYLSGQQRTLTAADPDDTRLLVDLALARDPVTSNTLAGIERPAREIAARMKRFDRIVVVRAAGVHAPGDPREEAKRDTLRCHFRAHTTSEVNGAKVTLYTRIHPRPGTHVSYRTSTWTAQKRCGR
ncbi:glycosyltransferase family 39 protein [Streptomyces sp. DSS69]|uniref:glycosyltransferase family 39 protein n=1 Tax=Streptomyces sp. DSS69 TaxID=3113369 RepID=UPI0031F91CD6